MEKVEKLQELLDELKKSVSRWSSTLVEDNQETCISLNLIDTHEYVFVYWDEQKGNYLVNSPDFLSGDLRFEYRSSILDYLNCYIYENHD